MMNSQDRNGEKPGKRPRHSRRSLLGSAALSVTALALAVPAVAAFSGSETGSATDQIANTATTAELSATLQGQTVSVDGEEGSKGAALAELLGVEQSELRDALRSGESLGDFAAANGVERQVVVDELVSNMNERIDRGVENGRVTAERAAEMRAGIVQRAEAIVDGDAPLRGHKGNCGPGGEELAETLGVEQGELRDALRSGESLGDFAAANGVERQVVVDELVSNMNERIDRGVENGRVTAEQAAEMKAGAVERAEAIVDGDAPLRGGKGRHGPRGGPGNAPAAPEQAPALEESDPQLL